jgi:molybdopterin molybdotransferase
MTAKLIDDRFVLDKDRLPHAEAIAILKSRVRPIVDTEAVALAQATGRYLAEDIISPRHIPAHDNAAVDGYAFSHAAYDQSKGTTFKVFGHAAAGHPFAGAMSADNAVRIFTGAVMPVGFDTVAMQEDVRIEESADMLWALIPPGLKKGANRRRAGEDSQQGEKLVTAGTRLRPQDVASAAAIGSERVPCHARLKVAVFSTGDEILRPGETFSPGKVYDANSSMLQGLIAATGAHAEDLGVLPDKVELVKSGLADASGAFDAIIVSGGASQGTEDHVVKSLDAIGKRHLWQVAIKPGRPMSFGQIGDCVVLSLPGNPVAVFVCFLIYARPVLVTLGGGLWPEPQRFPLPAAFSQKKKVGRREFWRAKLSGADTGEFRANKFPRDGSGLISSLREADGLIEVPEEVGEVHQGELVNFIPFSEFGI